MAFVPSVLEVSIKLLCWGMIPHEMQLFPSFVHFCFKRITTNTPDFHRKGVDHWLKNSYCKEERLVSGIL